MIAHNRKHIIGAGALIWGLALAVIILTPAARADETCSSPYLARIEGQEEFVYVWTLGVKGLGDGSDKLVVVDVTATSETSTAPIPSTRASCWQM